MKMASCYQSLFCLLKFRRYVCSLGLSMLVVNNNITKYNAIKLIGALLVYFFLTIQQRFMITKYRCNLARNRIMEKV